jgi:hypothetical protein
MTESCMKRRLPVLAFILLFISTASLAVTTPNTANVSGSWELGTHWSAGHAPTNTEDAIIPAGMAMTINAADICASLTIGNATNAVASVTVVGANTLTLSTAGGGTGNLTMNPSNVASAITLAAATGTIIIPGTVSSGGNAGGTISVSTGTLSFTNAGAWTWADAVNLSITGTGTASFAGALTLNSASTTNFTMSAAGHLTFTGLLTQNAATYTITNTTTAGFINFNGGYNLIVGTFTTLAAETINIGGSFTSSLATGLILNASSNAIFTASATITPTTAITFGNLQILAGVTVTLAGNINVAGATWTNNGGTFTPSTYAVTFNGAANQSITGTAATQTFYDIILNLTAGKALTGAGSTTTLVVNNFTETTGNYTPGTITTLTIKAACALTAGTFSSIAGETINFAGAITNNVVQTLNASCTAIFSSASTITPVAALTFGNIQINATATLTLAGNVLVAGATWVNNGGTFAPSTYKVTFNGVAGQTIGGTSASQTFYDLTANLTAGQTLSGAGSLTSLVVNNFTETTGNFSPGTITTLSINGNCILTAGVYSSGASETINFAGNVTIGVAQTLNPACTAIFTGTSTITTGALALTFGNVLINSGATVTLAGNILVAGATWTNNGGIFTPATFKVTFNGAAGQTIGGTVASQTFYDVVANLTAGQTLSNAGSTTALIFNNYTQTTGNFNASALTSLGINASCTLTAGTFTAAPIINILGNWSNNGGTFSPGTGVVNFNGIANQSIGGTAASQTFNDLTLNLTAGKALSGTGSTTALTVNNFTETTGNFTSGTISTLTINANWLISAGVFSTNALETINFVGALNNAVAVTFNATSTEVFTSSSTITPSTALTFGNVQINSGSTVILAGNILVAGATWTNNGGTFTPATYSVTFNGANNQTITGTIATPTFYSLVVNLTAGKTLTCAGSATSLLVYNYTETTGNFSPGTITTMTINGNTIFTAGTCTAPATINTLGNWTNNGGTFTAGTGVVNFRGAAAQTINGTAAAQTFYDVVETLPAGIALSSTTTTLTFNNFTETTGDFTGSAVTTLTINANLTISTGTFTGAQTGASNTNVAGTIANASAFSTTGSLLFSGTLPSTVSGAGTWVLAGTGMTKTLKTTIVDIQLAAFITAVNTGGDNFTFTGGTWKFNTAGTSYTDIHNKGTTTALTISPNAVLEVDQGTVNLCANGTSNNVLIEGMLNLLGGTTNVQQGQAVNTGNDLRYKVVGGIAPQLYITTGAILNLGAGFNSTAIADYIDFNMTGGTINMCTNGYSKASTLLLNDVVGGKTVMTAGTIILQDACNAAATDLDMGNGNINPYTVTGGTIQFGNASTPAGATFYAITANPLTNYPNISTAGPVLKNVKSWNAGTINLLSLDISSNLTFDITGFNNNINFMGSNGTFTLNHTGTFNIGTGTFTFSGTIAQVITGSAPRTFGNIIINNTGGGVSLGVAETMTGTLTLTNGILNTLPNNTLTITAAGGATAGTATSFVDGPMAKIGNTAFVFPLGNGTKYARLGISAPSASTTMTAQYYHTGYPYYPGNLPLATVSGYEYWTLGEAAPSTVNVTLYWEDSVASGTSTYDNTLRVAHFNGASWDDKGQTALSSSGISGNITSVAVSNFSPFTFGSTNPNLNPLPVELLSFDAKADPGKEVDVSWSTASETNCDYYSIEHSKDGIAFEFLTRVKGAGNSTSILNYKTIDPHPYTGTSYYRLIQTDFNGKSKTFSPVSVNFEGDKTFAIFPNPNAANSPLYMKMDGAPAGEEVLVVLYSEMGRELYSKMFITTGDGLTNIGEAIGTNIPPGIYFITASSQNGIYKQKLLIR